MRVYLFCSVTLFENYDPNQFEILGFRKGNDNKDLTLNGEMKYTRILIKKKKNNEIC